MTDILANQANHDGVTILGGEPFDQPEGVAELIMRLKENSLHITVYTGYTLEILVSKNDEQISQILNMTDLLVDGPFVRELSTDAGEYRGSSNQRLIYQPYLAMKDLQSHLKHSR